MGTFKITSYSLTDTVVLGVVGGVIGFLILLGVTVLVIFLRRARCIC